MKCRICNNTAKFAFSTTLLERHKVSYYNCSNCLFLQTEKPFWLDEAYAEHMLALDTGIMWRNIELMKIFSVLIYFLFDKNLSFLDFGGGYGIFARLMRDLGFDFYLHDRYLSNIVARGFEYKWDIDKNFELVTSIECFEHLEKPIDEIEKMLKCSKNILFTTQLLPNPMPKPNEWFYYGPGHGQHISFYNIKTLKFLADKYSLNLYSDNNFIHLLTQKKISQKKFSYLVKYAPKLLWPYVSRKLKSQGVFKWIENDSNILKDTLEKGSIMK